MLKRELVLSLLLTALVPASLAQGPAQGPEGRRSSDLLDRGADVGSGAAIGPRTHMPPMATLAAGMGTPGAPSVMTAIPLPPVLSMSAPFLGYFFMAPVDFPSSYFPFFVTGAYAWIDNPGPPNSVVLAAGVAPTLFLPGFGMWGAFTAFPVTVASSGMGVIGMPSVFPHSPPPLAVPTGLGAACGAGRPFAAGPLLGGIPPGGPKPLNIFDGPPFSDFLTIVPAPTADYVVGCFISGATVPVELQSFSVE